MMLPKTQEMTVNVYGKETKPGPCLLWESIYIAVASHANLPLHEDNEISLNHLFLQTVWLLYPKI